MTRPCRRWQYLGNYQDSMKPSGIFTGSTSANFPGTPIPLPPADSPNAGGVAVSRAETCAGLKNYFTSNDPHHGIYSYIPHSSGKKYLNTQPGRRTPKSSIIFFHHVLAYPQSSCGWHKQWYKYFTYILSDTSTDTSFWHSFRHSIWHIFSTSPSISHI